MSTMSNEMADLVEGSLTEEVWLPTEQAIRKRREHLTMIRVKIAALPKSPRHLVLNDDHQDDMEVPLSSEELPDTSDKGVS